METFSDQRNRNADSAGRRGRLLKASRSQARHKKKTKIQLACDAIAREFDPEKIILFGSHAHGEPGRNSDIDLLVVMPFKGSPFRQAALILNHVVNKVGVLPMDLLVRTSKQVKQRLQLGYRFMRELMEHGLVMYEADHA